MHTFRVLLAVGAALIAGLALAGLFPRRPDRRRGPRAAPRRPLLRRGRPLRGRALARAGVDDRLGDRGRDRRRLHRRDACATDAATLQSQTTSHAVLWNGVLIPLIGLALVMAGPLVLLRYRKFNDVLDGVTFGGACAVVFAGAELLTHSSTFLAAGLEPPGLVTPWTVRLLTLGIAVPILAAASVGAASGVALAALPRAGARPGAARGARASRRRGAARGRAARRQRAAPALPRPLGRARGGARRSTFAALVWLRQLIHLGLLEEAAEIEVGPAAALPELRPARRRATRSAHTAASRCGRLPKTDRGHRRSGGGRRAGSPSGSLVARRHGGDRHGGGPAGRRRRPVPGGAGLCEAAAVPGQRRARDAEDVDERTGRIARVRPEARGTWTSSATTCWR